MRAWIKGGLIGLVLAILFLVFMRYIPDIYFYYENLTIAFYVFVIVYGILIGAIFGLLTGRVISSEKTTSRKGLLVGVLIGIFLSLIVITWNAVEKYWNPPTNGWPNVFWYLHFPPGGYLLILGLLVLGAIIGLIVGKVKARKQNVIRGK